MIFLMRFSRQTTDRLTLLQTAANWLAPAWIYSRTPAAARRNRGGEISIQTGEAVTDKRRLDWLERI